MQVSRIAPLLSRGLPREILRHHNVQYMHARNSGSVLSLIRSYSTPNDNKQSEAKQEPQQEQSQENQNQNQNQNQQEQQQQQGEQKSGGYGGVVLFGIIALAGAGIYYAPPNPISNFWNEHIYSQLKAFYTNLQTNVYHLFGISTEPVPFLPPPLPEGYGRKYTLVIDMDVLAECIQTNGAWKIRKRAGADYFLATLVRNYEIVLYSKEFMGTNQNAIFKLDPQGLLFQHQKFRDSGVKDANMEFTKDLHLFRRDPAKIIFIDSTPPDKTYPHTNVLCVGKPKLDNADTVLIDLTRILTSFAVQSGPDVRPLVQELQGPAVETKIRDLIARSSKAPAPRQQEQAPSSGGGLFGRIRG